MWDGVPVQRCRVYKHSNLLAHAPERLQQEVTAAYNDRIYAATPEEISARRKAFARKWRLSIMPSPTASRRPAIAFAFARLAPSSEERPHYQRD